MRRCGALTWPVSFASFLSWQTIYTYQLLRAGFPVTHAGEVSMALKSMSIDKLLTLKNQVEAILSSRVSEQRRALESELSKLGRFQDGAGRGKSALGRGGARGSVAPKYRNPDNASETWAGRGLKPRWLAAAIKAGKKAEDFLISSLARSSKANGRKKARKARK
jgi:DNA-binding protein H-NS